jgi:Holliday junction resolvasome RuvABC endonuclease subunit
LDCEGLGLVKIIHFDVGSNMALAHNGMGDDAIIVEHKEFTGNRQERAAATLRWLLKRFKQMKAEGIEFDAVHYERPFARGQAATRSLWGVAGVLEAASVVSGWATLDSTPLEIKKFGTGNAKASKEDMIAGAQKLGYKGTNEHEADAYIGLKYALKYVTKERP